MKEFDLAIIGAGAGGLNSAYAGLAMGKSVLLIDKHKPGGECTWFGCIPSKALIHIADEIHTAKKYADVTVDSKTILGKVRALTETAHQAEHPDVLNNAGIHYINGYARFKDARTLDVDGEEYTAKKIMVTPGSSPAVPPIKGLDQVEYLTNVNVFHQDELPETMVVLGAGAIGVELSQAMNRLGVRVTLVELSDSILPKEDKELSAALKETLISEGVNILTSAEAVSVNSDNRGICLTVMKDGAALEIEGERLLLALGRKPNVRGMGLETIGVDFDHRGIKVDEYLETSVKGVYAVGDAVGPYPFSHMAGFQARLAISNAFSDSKETVDYQNMVWSTFTHPELARSGMTEEEAKAAYGSKVKVVRFDFSDLDRAVVDEATNGMIKIIVDENDHILGASILGERASELVSELQVIKTFNHKLSDLKKVIHPYPSYSSVLQEL